jgi:parallel beta-helix repeat protein
VYSSLTIPSSTALVGFALPIIKAANGAFSGGGNVITLANGTSNVTINGVKIDANNANNGGNMYAVRAEVTSGCTIKNCHVVNFDYGILFVDGDTIVVDSCTVDTGTIYGICVKGDSLSEDCLNVRITNCEAKNITSGAVGPLAEGKGIMIYGRTGPLITDYKNIEDVVIANNICHDIGSNGIAVVAVSNFTISGNNCYNCLDNTDVASGILVSEACVNGAVTGNTCTDNYDAGILLDIADQTLGANYFLYGKVAITGNSCRGNNRTGIKINSCPFSTISGNQIDGRRVGDNTRWGIFLSNAGVNNIVGNNISFCSYNGIRLTAVGAGTPPSQQRVVIADNILTNIDAPSSDQAYSALYVDLWANVKIQNNLFSENTQDLTITADATDVTLLDNEFTSTIYTSASDSIRRWEDEFRTTAAAANWISTEFSGSGMSTITLASGFTIPHFGLSYLPIGTNGNNYTSDTTTAIYDGYVGQKIRVLKVGGGTLTIKQGANTDNISGSDLALSTGQMVEYTYTGSLWLQTTAALTTGL